MQAFWEKISPYTTYMVVGGLICVALLIFVPMIFSRRIRPAGGARARQPRLGIVDAYDLGDRQRQLVLVRRDNVEHLVLIGGPNDVLIESSIIRGAAPASDGRGRPAQPQDDSPQAISAPIAPVAPPLAPAVEASPPAPTPPAQPTPTLPSLPPRVAPEAPPPRPTVSAPEPSSPPPAPAPRTPPPPPPPRMAPPINRPANMFGAPPKRPDPSVVPPPVSPAVEPPKPVDKPTAPGVEGVRQPDWGPPPPPETPKPRFDFSRLNQRAHPEGGEPAKPASSEPMPPIKPEPSPVDAPKVEAPKIEAPKVDMAPPPPASPPPPVAPPIPPSFKPEPRAPAPPPSPPVQTEPPVSLSESDDALADLEAEMVKLLGRPGEDGKA